MLLAHCHGGGGGLDRMLVDFLEVVAGDVGQAAAEHRHAASLHSGRERAERGGVLGVYSASRQAEAFTCP
jgi:hypothetical protein